jgi:hypothetical protein
MTTPCVPADAATVSSVLSSLKLPGVHNYPADAPCSSAVGEGGRCVGVDRKACQSGLICFRWAPGQGKCHKPDWAKGQTGIYQASAGCSGTTPPTTIPPGVFQLLLCRRWHHALSSTCTSKGVEAKRQLMACWETV